MDDEEEAPGAPGALQEAGPDSELPYDLWTEQALRHVVAQALTHAGTSGLPGGHHFYVTFRTDHPRVVMPARLRAQYPQEITIVLQHQFWDLMVDQAEGLFSVGLSFGGVPCTLTVPLVAVTGFADPYVQFGLRFQPEDAQEAEPEPEAEAAPEPAPEPKSETPQVVSLDAFRRRSAPKE